MLYWNHKILVCRKQLNRSFYFSQMIPNISFMIFRNQKCLLKCNVSKKGDNFIMLKVISILLLCYFRLKHSEWNIWINLVVLMIVLISIQSYYQEKYHYTRDNPMWSFSRSWPMCKKKLLTLMNGSNWPKMWCVQFFTKIHKIQK